MGRLIFTYLCQLCIRLGILDGELGPEVLQSRLSSMSCPSLCYLAKGLWNRRVVRSGLVPFHGSSGHLFVEVYKISTSVYCFCVIVD